MPRVKGKPLLTPERILEAAVAHADAHGIEHLKMRQLADQLDAGAMSLYHHFSNKEALLEAMVEWVAGQIDLPEGDETWRSAVAGIAGSLYELMMLHRWVIAIWNQRSPGPNKLMYMESVLAALREAGFSVALACDAYHAIIAHIEGFSFHTAAFPVTTEEFRPAAEAFLDGLAEPERFPYVVEHVQHHLHGDDSSNQFMSMLNMILDGFEAKLDTARQAPSVGTPK